MLERIRVIHNLASLLDCEQYSIDNSAHMTPIGKQRNGAELDY